MRLLNSCTVATAIVIGLLSTASTHSPTPPQETMEMSPALFKLKGQLNAILPDFDFDAQCKISSFQLVRISKRTDPMITQNHGSAFNNSTRAIVQQAKPGDTYFFENIKARCPGDLHGRSIGAIVVKIQ